MLFGIGVGLILGVLFMLGYKFNMSISDAAIEEKARAMGMHYEGECKSLFERDDR